MRAPAFLAALLCAAAPVAAGDWPFYRHDLTGVSDANETLTAAQARTLQPDWIYYTHGLNYANPVVAGGLLFLTSGDGGYYVLDALTGGLRWKQYGSVLGPFHCLDPKFVTSKGPIGAPGVVGSSVFFPGADGVVTAFDTATGNVLWKTKIADVTNLGEFLWTSIFPLKGKLYLGISALHDCLLVAGRVVALDQATGAITGTWW